MAADLQFNSENETDGDSVVQAASTDGKGSNCKDEAQEPPVNSPGGGGGSARRPRSAGAGPESESGAKFVSTT